MEPRKRAAAGSGQGTATSFAARRGFLKNIRPSYLILLTALPFVVYLFASSDRYQAALKFLLPGLGTTALVTVVAYVAACALGLVLAGFQLLKQGERTARNYLIGSVVLLLGATLLLTRPQEQYALIGEGGGRVAIIQGTPVSASDPVKLGNYPGAEAPQAVRAVTDLAAALDRLQTGQVSSALIPVAGVPEGATVMWRTSFLAAALKRPGMLLLVLGLLGLALTFASWQSGTHPLRLVSELYVDVLRGIPMLVVILYVGFPLQGAIRDATGGFIDMSRVTRGIVGISFGYAAYLAEIFRAGIEAIGRGQTEAARSLGLTTWQTARFVVLPQALRIVVPPLGNEFIAMLKDTSLLSVLSVRDITQRAREFQAANFEVFPPFNTVAILYIVLTLMASSLAKSVERRTSWSR
ncbi:MAG: amino acid ABC transporter permease [Trueperaceae bacterium]|nr:amino acid ABC transporter permease [Trueperaceae bacterium]MCW5820174.1 amino acid ABC transporter permease [Trueperaceae bacterium]